MSRSRLSAAAVVAGLVVALPPGASADQPADPGRSETAPGQVKPAGTPAEGQATGQANGQATGQANGNGANQSGPYDPHGVGLPSGNGASENNNGNRPCAGCVGNADAKNPPGQLPGGSDPNKGYECDENQGVGKTNPAHSGCGVTTSTPPTEKPPVTPPENPPTPPQDKPSGAPQAPVTQGEAPQGGIRGEREQGGPGAVPEQDAAPEAPAAVPITSAPGDELPFTGQRLLLLMLLGASCVAAGLGIGRLISRRMLQM